MIKMKACDYKERTIGPKGLETPPCGKVATAQSSLAKRFRCLEHSQGPGWRPIEEKTR